MARREFLLLATPIDLEKHKFGGYYMSEKHDGIRCFWDGGLTRGMKTSTVPWAGLLHPKTGQPKADVTPIATGLWSRYGNPINAPDWFLNTLPRCPLDGELWAGRGRFQDVTSFCKKKTPIDSEWQQIQYAIFGTPQWSSVMQTGEVRNANQATDFNYERIQKWCVENTDFEDWKNLTGIPAPPFASELAHLVEWIDNTSDTVFLIPHTRLPADHEEAFEVALKKMKEIIAGGGEGLVLRDPQAVWEPKRLKNVLKFKDVNDSEGTVTGFVSGRETTKGSKLRGLIGAIILDFQGKKLELSGFTNEERVFDDIESGSYAFTHPGEVMPEGTQGKHFKLGDTVTFTYREFTKDGLPKEARYFRKRPEGT